MRYRSLLLIVAVSCGLHAAAARATTWLVYYTENHHVALQTMLTGSSDGLIAPGLSLSYLITSMNNDQGLAVGCEIPFGNDRGATFFLEYTQLFVESPMILGPYVSGGVGLGRWEGKVTPELRLGVGYALPLTERSALMMTLSDRLGIGDHLSASGIKQNFGAGIAFVYKFGETSWQ
jgi:hypothetical protein